eukprot:365766-Chlamydomonas_euryale.AAC.8
MGHGHSGSSAGAARPRGSSKGACQDTVARSAAVQACVAQERKRGRKGGAGYTRPRRRTCAGGELSGPREAASAGCPKAFGKDGPPMRFFAQVRSAASQRPWALPAALDYSWRRTRRLLQRRRGEQTIGAGYIYMGSEQLPNTPLAEVTAVLVAVRSVRIPDLPQVWNPSTQVWTSWLARCHLASQQCCYELYVLYHGAAVSCVLEHTPAGWPSSGNG